MTKGLVLVADDDAAVRTVVNQALTRAGYDVRITSNFSTLWQWIEEGEGDCVVSDVIMPDGDAFEVLPRIKELRPELPVILISAQNTFMTALKAQEGEAFDYLPKPFDLDKLAQTVERALFEPKSGKAMSAGASSYADEMPIIGRSKQMQEVYQAIARMRGSTLPVMLRGETGTGKSLVARVLHEFSSRASGKFEKITFSGMSAIEIEQVLFGRDGKSGVTSRLGGGTLYLNEIVDMPSQIQARTLQWLSMQDSSEHGGNVRVVCSTSDDLESAIAAGRFREDLYYHLSVVPLKLPPLRERLDDVPDLARHFLQKAALDGGVASHIDPAGMTVLKNHFWPGNVRELENLIQRLCLLYAKETLTENDIIPNLDLRAEQPQLDGEYPISGFANLREATRHFADRFFDEFDMDKGEQNIYQHFLSDFEAPLIISALRATNGNQIKAADILGLNRNTLRKKITAHNIRIVKTIGR